MMRQRNARRELTYSSEVLMPVLCTCERVSKEVDADIVAEEPGQVLHPHLFAQSIRHVVG